MTIQSKFTRFRAYQLGCPGSSFSYFNGSHFSLIEARLTDTNRESIDRELSDCQSDKLHNLHITSWDIDHCSPKQLEEILTKYAPIKIEYPGYSPHTDAGHESLNIIRTYKAKKSNAISVIQVTPKYISGLNAAKNYGYNDVLHHPKYLDDKCANNNSTVKHFRSGSFNVLSLGDVECNNIASGLRRQRVIHQEVDVMILAHHGANNGFTTSSFIKSTRPSVAIACADYANQFRHPKQEIRDLLHEHGVKLFTTKTGDVLIHSTRNHTGHYRVINYSSNNANVSSEYEFYARKSEFLRNNLDTIRAGITKQYRGPTRR